MDAAIAETIRMIGPGYLECLVCSMPTGGRGIYIPLDHREDLGSGEHFENMTRIYSFPLCDGCTITATGDKYEAVREALINAIKAAEKADPETIQ